MALRKKALATPVARAMAADMGIDINSIDGTGPGGRVIKNDIKNFHLKNKIVSHDQHTMQEENKVEFLPLTQIRKKNAK